MGEDAVRRFGLGGALGLALAALAGGAGAADPDTPVPVTRAAGAIEVDGRLDDPGWTDAAVFELPWEVRPADNGSAPVATRCMLTYDDRALYLGCRARDPDPAAIRAWVVDRDGIEGHDRIVLTLDPFDDQRRAFQFGISALGVQYDAVMAQQGTGRPDQGPDAEPVDPSWDAIWRSAGRITEDGYVVEAAVPFDALRFPRVEGPATWGMYLSRWWPRGSDTELRSVPWDRSDSCLLCQADRITGLSDIEPGAGVQFTPTFTASRTETRGVAPGLVAGPVREEFGADLQWGITSNLTLNLTANPDFSQVEADVAQIDANTNFALFFPERRPFFLEGADFFGTPLQAVFTRSIADPSAGAKITGKTGRLALGALAARDQTTNLLLPGAESSRSTSLDMPTTVVLGRVRTDVGGSSTVGALVTAREGEGYHNRVAGVDAFLRPLGSVTLQAQYLRSSTDYPAAVAEGFDQPASAFGGGAAALRANWTSRGWLVAADATHKDEGFRADAGFVPQVGRRGGSVNVIRRWWGDADDWYTQFRVQAGVWKQEDLQGHQLTGGLWFGVHWFGPGQTFVGLWPNLFMEEYYHGRAYRDMNQLYFTVSSAPTAGLRLQLFGNWGDVVDYANARRARQFTATPGVVVRLGRNTELDLRHSWARLSRDDGRVFSAHLGEVRAVYNFSARSYVRAVVQYRHTDRDPDRYRHAVDRRSRSLLTQLLYSYKLNPRTVLFAGYGGDRDAFQGPAGSSEPLTPRARTFFLKLGYAFQP